MSIKTYSTQDSLPMSVVHIACIDRVTEWIKPATLSELVLGKAVCPAHIRPTANAQHTATSLITNEGQWSAKNWLSDLLGDPKCFSEPCPHDAAGKGHTDSVSLHNLACQYLSNQRTLSMKTHSTQDSLPMSVAHVACIDRVTEWIKPAMRRCVLRAKDWKCQQTSLITNEGQKSAKNWLSDLLGDPKCFSEPGTHDPSGKGHTDSVSLHNLACQNLSNT